MSSAFGMTAKRSSRVAPVFCGGASPREQAAAMRAARTTKLIRRIVISFLNARGAPPPRALARRLRAALGPQALLNARGAPPPRALGPQALLHARGARPPRALARRLRAALGPQALLHARAAAPRRARAAGALRKFWKRLQNP